MQNIDFLPAEYRQKTANRHSHGWRAAGMFGAVALLAAVAVSQNQQCRRAREQLAAATVDYDTAVAQTRQRDQLQPRWEAARADAELFTYLRHPWPRTQILAAVLGPLPESITLDRVEIRTDAPRRANPSRALSRTQQEAEDAAGAKLPPATRDLRQLREQMDPAPTIATLSGTTRRVDLLHQYLGELARSPLVAKAELDSLESVAQQPDAEGKEEAPMRFAATIVVRPGYGQPSGPTGPDNLAQAKDTRSPTWSPQ